MTPFNKPYFIGTEIELLKATFASGDVSGNGGMTKKCHAYFEKRWGFGKCLFTASCLSGERSGPSPRTGGTALVLSQISPPRLKD